jgi:hypothetical protein
MIRTRRPLHTGSYRGAARNGAAVTRATGRLIETAAGRWGALRRLAEHAHASVGWLYEELDLAPHPTCTDNAVVTSGIDRQRWRAAVRNGAGMAIGGALGNIGYALVSRHWAGALPWEGLLFGIALAATLGALFPRHERRLRRGGGHDD